MHDLRPNQRLALWVSRVYAPKSKPVGHEGEYFSVQCQSKKKKERVNINFQKNVS